MPNSLRCPRTALMSCVRWPISWERALWTLHRHERHARPPDRLADRLGINRISLAALDVGLDVLRRHQLHGVPELGNLTCPVMRTAARLHADQTRRQLGEERQYLFAPQLPGDDDLALGIDAVDLEHLLCKIEPDGGKCCHGRPPLVIRHQRSLYGTRCLAGRRPPHHFQGLLKLHSRYGPSDRSEAQKATF